MRTILGRVEGIAGKTLLLLCLCLSTLPLLHAKEAPHGKDLDHYKWRTDLFWWYSQPSGYFEGQNHEGKFDLSKDFRFGSYSTFTGTLDWRFKRKHHLLFASSPVSYSNSVTLVRTSHSRTRRTT